MANDARKELENSMATDVSRELERIQTGAYIPTKADEVDIDNKPKREVLGYSSRPLSEYQSMLSDPLVNARNTYVGQEAAEAGYGTSRFDRGPFEPGMDLENSRALEQSGGSKILNGALKGGVVAATTAVETVAGVIDGLLEGGYELARQIAEGETVSMPKVVGKGVNNFTARTMADIQKLSEEWFPNYRTEEERSDQYQDEWLKHIFSANFIGDSFLKNFGFTVGAMLGGAVWSKAISAGLKAASASDMMKGVVAAAEGNAETKSLLENTLKTVRAGSVQALDEAELAKAYSAAAKGLNKMATRQQLFGGVIAAMGEGTFEGVMARNEFLENNLAGIDEEYYRNLKELEENFVEEHRNTSYTRAVPVLYADGSKDIIYELNEDGENALEERRQNLRDEYGRKKAYANELGDRVAATTFMWNLPILTVSNVMQFGRMLSGGYNTSRNIAKTTGKVAIEEGKLVSDVAAKSTGKGAIIGKAALKSIRNGATEGAEEMAQGFVSSGAKHIADARLTSFNDDGYDRMAMSELGDWVGGMLEGGMDYLKEGRNWQEGFLGLVTGLVGIPGKPWNGGIAEGYRDARQEVKGAEDAAAALNTLIGSEKFQKAWKGYVRHMKYDAEMEEAAREGDKYSWKTANDKQLVNDIITFANAGRLQDLNDIVDYYASVGNDESKRSDVTDAVSGGVNETEIKNNPDKYISNVEENAAKIKEAIKMYNDMYDAMSTIAPAGASQSQLEEMIAASMNIKEFEQRFLKMFDEVIKEIRPYVNMATESENGEEAAHTTEITENARNLYSSLAGMLTNIGAPTNATILEDIRAIPAIMKFETIIGENAPEELKQKFTDMKKIAADRKAFVKKLLTLKDTEPDTFNEKAQNPDKINKQMKKEKVEAETAGLDDVNQIKQAYSASDNKDSFIEGIRIKASEKHQPSSEFLELYDSYENFREHLANKYPKVVNRNTGGFNFIAEIMLDDIFRSAENKDDLIEKLSNPAFDYADIQTTVQRMVEAGTLNEGLAAPPLMIQLFKVASDAIKTAGEEYKGITSDSAGKDNIGSSKKEKESKPIDDDASPEPTITPKKEEKAVEGIPEKNAEMPSENSPEEQEEPVNAPFVEDVSSDAYSSTPVDDSVDEAHSYVSDKSGYSVLGYYQQSIPEIDTLLMDRVRELIKLRKTASEEELELIDSQLRAIVLPDFVQYDKDGNPIGENAGFGDAYKWLVDSGAFEYIATKLNVDDEVVFVKISDAPKYRDESPIVVAVVTKRDSEGNVSEVQPLTFLSRVIRENSSVDYLNLDKLYEAIADDEKAQPVEGGLYVFGGKKNPHTSRVWGKRPGLVRYNYGQNAQQPVNTVTDYDSSAPIIILDNANQPVFLRGKVDPNKIFLPNMYPWSASHAGRVYYLVKNGKDSYIPILLEKAAITSQAVANAPDGSYLAGVRNDLKEIKDLLTTPDDIAQKEIKLKTVLKSLNKKMNLDGLTFELDSDETQGLYLSVQEKEQPPFKFSVEDKILSILDAIQRPARIGFKDNYIESSRKNLESVIESGLLTSNAQELRQVGVNFMFDPWDAESGKFDRVINQNGTLAEKAPVKQKIAKDAEFDEPVEMGDVEIPSAPKNPINPKPASSEMESLESLLGNINAIPEIDVWSNYSELPESVKSALKEDGKTEKDWENFGVEMRKKYLNCKG